MPVALSHVEYLTRDEIGEDDVAWLAELFDLPPTGEYAFLCAVDAQGQITFMTEDIDYARLLDEAAADGPIELSAEVATEKLPLNRRGWPGSWMGLE